VLAIKRDIDRKMPVEEWRRIILSTAVEFQAVEEADMSWVAGTIREHVGAQYNSVYYSSVTPPIWAL